MKNRKDTNIIESQYSLGEASGQLKWNPHGDVKSEAWWDASWRWSEGKGIR